MYKYVRVIKHSNFRNMGLKNSSVSQPAPLDHIEKDHLCTYIIFMLGGMGTSMSYFSDFNHSDFLNFFNINFQHCYRSDSEST